MNGGVEVRVEGTTVVHLVATPPIAAKVLAGPGGHWQGRAGPVLMLVGSAAGLLEGDSIHLRVDLAAGARLTLRSTAATIAHPCRDGGWTALDVECRLGQGAQLAWLPEPLIACAGCDHRGRTRLAIAPGATVTWLDTLVLGRSGEVPGRLAQRLDAEFDGRPLLREALRVDGSALVDGLGRPRRPPAGPTGAPGWDGPAVLGGYRHVANLHLLGRRVPVDVAGVMQLAGPGSTARLLAHRGDALARQVAGILPHFLQHDDPLAPASGPGGQSPKEALHV